MRNRILKKINMSEDNLKFFDQLDFKNRIRNIDPNQFTLSEWSSFINLIYGKSIQFNSCEEAKNFILKEK